MNFSVPAHTELKINDHLQIFKKWLIGKLRSDNKKLTRFMPRLTKLPTRVQFDLVNSLGLSYPIFRKYKKIKNINGNKKQK
jgi:hypothetical protein